MLFYVCYIHKASPLEMDSLFIYYDCNYNYVFILTLAMSTYDLALSFFIMLKLPPYLNCSKSPTMQPVLNFSKGSFGQKKPVLCSFQGKWFSSWVVLASLWWSTRSSFLFLWYTYVLMVTFLILYMIWHIATMHAWIQLAVALAHVLMYYYGNTASSIRRDLTRA